MSDRGWGEFQSLTGKFLGVMERVILRRGLRISIATIKELRDRVREIYKGIKTRGE